jgi:hypothetical protein
MTAWEKKRRKEAVIGSVGDGAAVLKPGELFDNQGCP